jgi:glucans biosynthesis protein
MVHLSRRTALQGLAALAAAGPALAQQSGPTPFRFEDVIRRARELAGVAHDPAGQALPEPLGRLDFDAYRDLRFRPDRALLGSGGGPFRMHLFHLGFLYQRPVTVNVIRDGVPTPVAYQPQLFDYGRTKIERPLPVNLGFAGFRLHYPLNDPRTFDELIAFLGSSYFRFLGRGQRYGLSARGLAVNVDGNGSEEFPFFREFWIDSPAAGADKAVVYALLDSPSATGAYRFEIYPTVETTLDVAVTLFPRRTVPGVGLAPLTSMFFTGENDRHRHDDFRPELHDSDGLLLHTASGEWIWRPLHNPMRKWVSAFGSSSATGFSRIIRTSRRTIICALATGSSQSAIGATGMSSSSRFRPATRPSTTSSPTGGRGSRTRQVRRSRSAIACAPSPTPTRCIRAARS